LGRTLDEWAEQITNWHLGRYSNGPAEGANNRIKRVKRAGYGIHQFNHLRVRALLYTGDPNWDLLQTITPRQNAEIGYHAEGLARYRRCRRLAGTVVSLPTLGRAVPLKHLGLDGQVASDHA
jgi:hypothetical protein